MESLWLVAVVALTSAGAFLVGARRGAGRPRGALRHALVRACELVGLAVGFLALNLVVGVAAVLVLRRLTGSFVSLYLNTDLTLVALSVLQAAVWQWWGSGGSGGAEDAGSVSGPAGPPGALGRPAQRGGRGR